ncbi:MAG: ABC transporter permease [Bacteroidota bacterium]
MLITYFKIALRYLLRSKLHAGINITGLALGIASVFFMSIYMRHEWGYDKYLPGYENIYRITWESENPQTRTPHPMAQALVSDFPEVESGVSLSPLWAAGLTREVFSFRNLEKDIRYDEANVLAVDSTFFDVFGFPVIKGDAKEALRHVNGLLISESMARKYFGDEDPIGKQLAVNSDSTLLQVMAIFKDVPPQSHFHFDFLVSYVREKSFDPEDAYYSWADFGHFNYVRLRPGADFKALEAELLTWARQYINVTDEQFRNMEAGGFGFRLQPIADIHLKSHLRWELEPNGNIEYVYIMAGAALLTLVIACINFMNLMTAKSTERAKEIGIRKTLGAVRGQISAQFLNESVLMAVLSLMLALLLIEGGLPFYNAFTGQHFEMDYVVLLPTLLLVGLAVGLLSGIYPSLILSAMRPQAILKGNYRTGTSGSRLRSVLIVFQFAISMALVSGAVIIYSQMKYIRNKSLGFDKELVVTIPMKNEALRPRMQALKNELMRIEGVSHVSASSNLPGGQYNQNAISLVERPQEEVTTSEAFVDYDFLKVMGIGLVEGRFYLPENMADSGATFVINETAARQLNIDPVVGREINWYAFENDEPIRGRVIGVMEDFHFQSLHEPVRPLLFVLYPAYNHLVVKINSNEIDKTLAGIQETYAQFDNQFEFQFSFLDERLNGQYVSEQQTGVIFTAFAVLAIAIACFGLFAMALLSFQHRIKEVGIRKVLGASQSALVVLLLKDFTQLILVAIVVAIPFAWVMMDRWLDNFVYQVTIHPALFVLSGLLLLVLAWMILGYLTLRTSRINPSDVLKAE